MPNLCSVCQKRKPKRNRKCCQHCLDYNRKMKLRWRKEGRCIFCGKASGGSVYCPRCSANKRTLFLSPEDRDKARADLAATEMRCHLCGSDKHFGMNWSVDHNHKNNRYRGILCQPCNTGIGLLREDPELLLKAIEYLKRGWYSGPATKGD